MFRFVPPAGAPISLIDIVRSVTARMNYKVSHEGIEEKVRQYSKQTHCFFVDSGRTALLLGLKALAKQADAFNNEVIIPAYTCFTVPAAIVRSGLTIRPVDIDPMTMDYDYDRLNDTDFSKVLAIVGNNLFGIPSDWNKLKTLADEKSVYLIDDSAQALGLSFDGKPLGSFGDFGFYSLGRGKNLSAYSGGVLVTSDDRLAGIVTDDMNNLSTNNILSEFVVMAKTALLSFFIRPELYWIPAKMPFLKLGETIFEPEFTTGVLSPFQVSLTGVVFDHLQDFNDRRRENASQLIEGIKSLNGYTVSGANGDDRHAYLRLPVLTESRDVRDRVITALSNEGISASSMYPSTVHQIPDIAKYLTSWEGDFAGADQVVDKLVTLPTHPYLKKKDITRIIATLARS